MSKSAVITTRLDADTLNLVDQVAAAQGRSRADFAAEAIRRIAESESDLMAFLQKGIDAADRGELVPHDRVMAELDQRIAAHQARCGR